MSTIFRLLTTSRGRKIINATLEAAAHAGRATLDFQVRKQEADVANAVLSLDFNRASVALGRDLTAAARREEDLSLAFSMEAVSGLGQIFNIADKAEAKARYTALNTELIGLQQTMPGDFIELLALLDEEFGAISLDVPAR
jgi:hypothetical protein